MKILAVTAGRKNGNTELIAKTVLKVAKEEFDAEVAMLNLHDHPIKPCIGCESCITNMYKTMSRPKCIHNGKDDFELVMKEWENADGILIAVPSYFQQEPGILKVLTDRWLCFEYGNMFNCGIIDKIPERRVAILSVGGSAQTWQNLTCDQIQAQLSCQDVKVVDKYIFTRAASSGHVLAKTEKMDRVKEMARNLCKACQIPYDDVKFMAKDYKYFCPICHSNLITRGYPHWEGSQWKYECAICEAGGDLVMGDDGEIIFQVSENGTMHCRANAKTRENHLREIQSAHAQAIEDAEIIQEERTKLKDFVVRKI